MTKTKERTVEEELREVEQEIESMERELAEREQPIVWGEVDAGELEAKERRRAILPRLITAARIKRLELLRRQTESELEPLRAEREDAHKKLERATAKRFKAEEEMLEARQAWSDPHTRIEKRERHLKDLDRQLHELREGRA
jgi:GTPase involved in cell partitioning and DNA repair